MRPSNLVVLSAVASLLFSTEGQANRVASIHFIGEKIFETGLQLDGTEVGGLSAITYDYGRELYYTLSDDRKDYRWYTAGIDVSDDAADGPQIDVQFNSVTFLKAGEGQPPFAPEELDPEGLTLVGPHELFLAEEGVQTELIDPSVRSFSLGGTQDKNLFVPHPYLPTADESSGVRNNAAFESLTVTPDRKWLITATENALFQDGPAPTTSEGTLCRILIYDLRTHLPVAEDFYYTDPIAEEPEPADEFSTTGLVELLAINNEGSFLALERSFSVGKGNKVRLYEIHVDLPAHRTLRRLFESLPAVEETPDLASLAVDKTLVFDFDQLGIELDNVEGMTLGPKLADGRHLLVFVSDNNFDREQFTQFLFFSVTFAE
ncbi:unnamed protein product [Vitrella brassicaformis CCMP3155]|uniref:Phytase-like domain-containing protein n=1 Tax=Vitrella brassicaformis (strain CCMP3155) TaxID=1169540 RepID=A0A0G4ENH8_VITBC|nr:unnamed protein product [Vitrella brassicaformis CCMP3155]|eukprot:CEL99143.1 unnamed protein product [Vitrella brassicaformis CCMP3155]